MNDAASHPAHGAPQQSAGCAYEPSAESLEQRVAERLAHVRHRVLVLSGKGGVGKSTAAVNLAVALAERGESVGLLDIDLHGPSVPKMLHLENYPLQNHDGAVLPVQFTMNLKVMSIGFFLPSEGEAVIWRGPRKFSMIQQFLADVEWGDLDYLIVDAPPGTGDEPLAIVELLGHVDGAIVVTTPQAVAISDVRKCVSFCRTVKCPVLGILENMSGLVCPHCGERINVFAEGGGEALAREAGVAFLGSIPLDPDLVKAGDSGRPFLLTRTRTPAAEAFKDALAPILALDADDN